MYSALIAFAASLLLSGASTISSEKRALGRVARTESAACPIIESGILGVSLPLFFQYFKVSWTYLWRSSMILTMEHSWTVKRRLCAITIDFASILTHNVARYKGFFFNGNPVEWIVTDSNPGVVSPPNAIDTGDQFTDFIQSDNTYTFDIASFWVTGVATDPTAPTNVPNITIQMQGTKTDGSTTSTTFIVTNRNVGGVPIFFDLADKGLASSFSSLRSFFIAARTFDSSHIGGLVIQDTILDDISYVKRSIC